MTTQELLSKIHDYFQTKTQGKISRQLLDILPREGEILEQVKDLGILKHEGKQVEALKDETGHVIDLIIEGKALLNSKDETKSHYQFTALSETSFELSIKSRTYRILALDRKKQNKLLCTLRLEIADKLHIDTVNLYLSSQVNKLIQDICTSFQFPQNEISEDFQTIIKLSETYQFKDPQSQKSVEPQEMTSQEKEEALNFAKNPRIFAEILKDYQKLGSIGEENNKLIAYLAAVSRLFEKPLSIMVISSSGAGKSELVNKTLSLMPKEDVLELTSLSAKALFYKSENSLEGKILSLEEDLGGENATYAIRQVISSSSLTVESTVRDQLDGKIKTQKNQVKCQTAVFITSTNPNTDPETKSRFFILHVDESEEQTNRILELQKQSRLLSSLTQKQDKEQIKRKHQNLQRLLKLYPIVNPFVDSLAHDNKHLGARRNFPKYLCLIDSICLLRQYQKELKTHHKIKYLEVEEEDLKIAQKLFNYVVENSMSELNTHSRELLKIIKKKFLEKTFSRKEIRELTYWSLSKVQRAISELLKFELLVLESGGRGKVHLYRLIQTYSKQI